MARKHDSSKLYNQIKQDATEAAIKAVKDAIVEAEQQEVTLTPNVKIDKKAITQNVSRQVDSAMAEALVDKKEVIDLGDLYEISIDSLKQKLTTARKEFNKAVDEDNRANQKRLSQEVFKIGKVAQNRGVKEVPVHVGKSKSGKIANTSVASFLSDFVEDAELSEKAIEKIESAVANHKNIIGKQTTSTLKEAKEVSEEFNKISKRTQELFKKNSSNQHTAIGNNIGAAIQAQGKLQDSMRDTAKQAEKMGDAIAKSAKQGESAIERLNDAQVEVVNELDKIEEAAHKPMVDTKALSGRDWVKDRQEQFKNKSLEQLMDELYKPSDFQLYDKESGKFLQTLYHRGSNKTALTPSDTASALSHGHRFNLEVHAGGLTNRYPSEWFSNVTKIYEENAKLSEEELKIIFDNYYNSIQQLTSSEKLKKMFASYKPDLSEFENFKTIMMDTSVHTGSILNEISRLNNKGTYVDVLKGLGYEAYFDNFAGNKIVDIFDEKNVIPIAIDTSAFEKLDDATDQAVKHIAEITNNVLDVKVEGEKSANAITESTQQAQVATEKLADVQQEVDKVTSGLDEMGQTGASAGEKVAEGMKEAKEETEKAQEAIKDVLVYRGTNGDYLTSNASGATFWSTEIENAKKYGTNADDKALYSAKVSMKNPLTIDAHGDRYGDITYLGDGADKASQEIIELTRHEAELRQELEKLNSANEDNVEAQQRAVQAGVELYETIMKIKSVSDDETNPYGKHSTDWFADYAKKNGYDGVHFKNVIDTPDAYTQQEKIADVYVTFLKEQIKDVQLLEQNNHKLAKSEKEVADARKSSNAPIRPDSFQYSSSELDAIAQNIEADLARSKYLNKTEEELKNCLEIEERWQKRCKEGSDAYNKRTRNIEVISQLLDEISKKEDISAQHPSAPEVAPQVKAEADAHAENAENIQKEAEAKKESEQYSSTPETTLQIKAEADAEGKLADKKKETAEAAKAKVDAEKESESVSDNSEAIAEEEKEKEAVDETKESIDKKTAARKEEQSIGSNGEAAEQNRKEAEAAHAAAVEYEKKEEAKRAEAAIEPEVPKALVSVQAEDLSPVIMQLTNIIELLERKNNLFIREGSIVAEEAAKESSALQGVANVLKEIVGDLQALNGKGVKLSFTGLNNLKQLTELDVNKLDERLIGAFDKIADFAKELGELKVDDSSFVKSINDMLKHGEELKNLATALKASKKQIDNVTEAISKPKEQPQTKVDLSEWKELNKVVKEYYELKNTDSDKLTQSEQGRLTEIEGLWAKVRGEVEKTTAALKEQGQSTKLIEDVTRAYTTGFAEWQNQQVLDTRQAEVDALKKKVNPTASGSFVKRLEDYPSKYVEEATAKVSKLQALVNDLNAKPIDMVTAEEIADAQKLANEIQQGFNSADWRVANQTKVSNLQNEISMYMKNFSALSEETKGKLRALNEELDHVGSNEGLAQAVQKFNKIKIAARDAGEEGTSFFSKMGKQIEYLNAQAFAMYLSWQDIIRYIRQAAGAVIELDSALTELRKVSDASTERLQQSFETSAKTAKELGSTVDSVINQTADWSRLNIKGLLYSNV